MDDYYVIYQSRARTARLLVLSLALAAGGAYVITVDTLLRRCAVIDTVFTVIGVIGLLFSLLCAGVYLARLFSRKPLVEIDSDGMVDNASAVAVGRIRWTDIRAVRVITVARQEFIAIWLTDESMAGRPSTLRQRWTSRINRRFGWGTANIPQSILPVPLPVVVDRINSHRAGQQKRQEE